MVDHYLTESTSKQTASVRSPVVLSQSTTTRKVLHAELIDNPRNEDATVSVAIVHQRKGKNDEWEDIPAEPLTKLKAGDQMKMALDTEETLCLYQQLQNLYAIVPQKGILRGSRTVAVVPSGVELLKVPAGRKEAIKALVAQNHSEEVWRELLEQQPDLATRLSYARLHEERSKALAEFANSLNEDRDEPYWQEFFKRNTWIFGYGLKYQFLDLIQSQPHYGGTAFTGRGAQRGDYLTATAAEARFTVLVEIKRPDSELLQDDKYRNGGYPPNEELVGGVCQLQVNCRKWEIEGSRLEQNVESLQSENVFTVSPKGILVIGKTNQLTDHDRRVSFELFRRSIVNPEIVTFDEVYERAQYIVQHTATAEEGGDASVDGEAVVANEDDGIPF